jgi:hypothetical protein
VAASSVTAVRPWDTAVQVVQRPGLRDCTKLVAAACLDGNLHYVSESARGHTQVVLVDGLCQTAHKNSIPDFDKFLIVRPNGRTTGCTSRVGGERVEGLCQGYAGGVAGSSVFLLVVPILAVFVVNSPSQLVFGCPQQGMIPHTSVSHNDGSYFDMGNSLIERRQISPL